MTDPTANRRQLLYWHTLVAALAPDEEGAGQRVDALAKHVTSELGLPTLIHDARATTDQVLRRVPDMAPLLRAPREDDALEADDALRRVALYLKAVRNVFAGGTGESVSAEEYSNWLNDVRAFERANGYRPGGLFGRTGTAMAPEVQEGDVEEALAEIEKGEGLMSEPELKAGLQGIEKRMIDRMNLREVLKDARLAAKLTPSMALTEQLLRDKNHLTGPALAAAKRLIKRYVDELSDVLKREVMSSATGQIDRSVPPKRVFRNLDLKRTIWANLVNWDPRSERLYVDRLHYRHRARKNQSTRLIIVVDQSGSMIPAMVNCTILASIFAGLPRVEARLIAFDTVALDLSPWVHDPFEVLLRTNLGGGNDGPVAMPFVHGHMLDPRNTVVVWISDFYDTRELMPLFTNLVRAGVQFIPVGSVSSSGYFSVDPWFRKELKALGTPVLSGSLKSLIRELKAVLP